MLDKIDDIPANNARRNPLQIRFEALLKDFSVSLCHIQRDFFRSVLLLRFSCQ
jgi:hypothetical protein